MRKTAVLSAVLVIVAVSAGTAFAAEYDRYERGYTREEPSFLPPPPPPTSPYTPRAATVPPQTHMNYGPGYLGIQLGVYTPNSDLEGLSTYDSGVAFNVMLGSRMTPFFAVEGSAGYFRSHSGYFPGDLSVVPVTVGGRFIIPSPIIEPYVGAGVGIYFVSLKEDYPGVKGDRAEFGGYISLGGDFWLSPRVALNVEGRYQWVESKIEGFNIDLSGWSVLFGARIPF